MPSKNNGDIASGWPDTSIHLDDDAVNDKVTPILVDSPASELEELEESFIEENGDSIIMIAGGNSVIVDMIILAVYQKPTEKRYSTHNPPP